MMHLKNISKKEQGFVLIASLLILLILVIIGVAATTNTTIEVQIAGNEKVHKETFYNAEGSLSVGVEVLEQNLYCPTGFSATGVDDGGISVADLEGVVRVYERNGNELALYQNPSLAENVIEADINAHALNDVSFTLPIDPALNLDDLDAAGTQRVSYIYIGGRTEMAAGGALQMAAGYEGKGKSAAGGGVLKLYEVTALHQGRVDSRSIIQLGWRFPVGWTGDCNY
ncbi:MAG: PilX N-terminal domain-containing pilus assembly protein [Thermodesulfobacteriota bacterium]